MNDATLPEPVRPPANATGPPEPAAVAPAPVRRYRARLFQLYVLLATLAFGGLAFFAHSVNYFPLDVQITLAIQSIHNGVFDVLMRYLTILGFAPQATLLSALTGPSRIYAGEHWASDVAGSYLLGSVWLLLAITLYRWGKPRFFVTQPVAAEPPQDAAQHT